MYGDKPEPWDFSKRTAADLVVIHIGTNDNNQENNVSTEVYIDGLTKIIQEFMEIGQRPKSLLCSLSGSAFTSTATATSPAPLVDGSTRFISWSSGEYASQSKHVSAKTTSRLNSDAYLRNPVVYDGDTKKTFKTGKRAEPFVHYFNTTGIMQHNDIAPQWHPTDVGAIKVASHLQQFIRMKFDWDFCATGPEVLHETLYWNDEPAYLKRSCRSLRAKSRDGSPDRAFAAGNKDPIGRT
ncbi:hypothetical protein VTI74DRAFT_4795 [Chaetomium olivicolor]